MGVRAKLSTKGFEAYLERIVAAGRDIDKAAAEALTAGADVLVQGMQRRAPKDTHNLEDHIQTKGPERDGNFTFIVVGIIHDRAYTDAETARYAIAQEYGWADRRGARAGHPYIRPTIDQDMAKARKVMRQVLERWGAL